MAAATANERGRAFKGRRLETRAGLRILDRLGPGPGPTVQQPRACVTRRRINVLRATGAVPEFRDGRPDPWSSLFRLRRGARRRPGTPDLQPIPVNP